MDEGLTKRLEHLTARIPLSAEQLAHQQAGMDKATITVLLEFPERAKPVFAAYEQHKPGDGIRLARAAIQQYYEKSGIDGVFRRVAALPPSFVRTIAKQPFKKAELDYFFEKYVEQQLG